MTARAWPCTCRPITAIGHFAHGRKLQYLLHGPSCDEPLERRATIVYRTKAAA
jgi:hypothetical protein